MSQDNPTPTGNTFISRLREIVTQHGQRPAVVVDGVTILNYAELWHAAGLLSAKLKEQGVGRESLVGISLPKSAQTIVSVIGTWRAGGAWVPIDPDLPLSRIEFLKNDSGAQLVIDSSSDLLPCLESTQQDYNSNAGFARDARDVTELKPSIQLNDLAYVIYTSGSTGQPKGVEVTHLGLVNMLDQQIDVLRLGPDSRSLFLLSPSFDAAVSDIGTALLSGASIWIETELFRNGRLAVTHQQLLKLIAQRRITYVDLPPSVLAKLDPSECPESLETILVGGEVCPQDAIAKWAQRVRLINVYGPTEATICTSLSVCGQTWSRPLIGQPLNGVEYRIDGQANQGELLIGGSCLARGYRNRPQLTKEKFFDLDGQRFYRTGDIVRRDPDGEYVFCGRADRQMKIRGHRIEPGEIESKLLKHPDVDRALVVEYLNGMVAVIAMELDSGEKAIASQLRKRVGSSLPSFYIPQQFFFVDSMPLTTTGKIDIAAVVQRLESISESARHSPEASDFEAILPRNRVLKRPIEESEIELESEIEFDEAGQRRGQERILTGIFRHVLGHGNFSSCDHFFDIGGDSLSAMGVCAMARSHGLSFSPQRLIEVGSVKQICASLTENQNCATSDSMTASQLRSDVEALLSTNQRRPKQTGLPTTMDNWSPLDQSAVPRSTRLVSARQVPNCFLLTGSTGFLGLRILSQLLNKSSSEIVCLVRGSNDKEARQRLINRLAENRIRISHQDWNRVKVIAGDVSQANFGWTDQQYEKLANQVDRVIHSAAEVNTVLTYEHLRSANVVGTNEVAQFAVRGLPKKLEYISTLSVFVGTDRFTGPMLESDDLSATKRVYGGYAQSKWAAEHLLRKRTDVDTRFYRLGLLTQDTQTRRFPQRDLLTLAIKGVIELKAVPFFNEQLTVDVTPVNYAADVFLELVSRQTSENTFHIAHPNGLSARRLFGNLRKVSPSVKEVSVTEFEQRILVSNLSPEIAAACLAINRQLNPNQHLRPAPTDLFQATNAQFEMRNTQKYLRETGVEPPELNDEFVQQMIHPIVRSEMAVGIE